MDRAPEPWRSLALPVPNPARLAVRVTRDAARQIRGGHPWVYDSSITSIKGGATAGPGDLAVVFDDDRQFMAIGLYDPGSPIRLKILHQGRPVVVDEGLWRSRLRQAIERRVELSASGSTTAYRVVHGENDGLPGLVLDRYDDVLVLKLYSAVWFAHLRTLLPIVVDELAPSAIVLRLSRAVRPYAPSGLDEGTALVGAVPTEPVRFVEHGLRFEADVVRGQKTGHFLDQRDNRALVRSMAAGACVLDVFACTGGFSVAAAAGGAPEVTSVDLSAPALAAARRNMALNEDLSSVRDCRHRVIVGDAFALMGQLAERRERFDLVIVDPPSFASNQAGVGRALQAYGRLTELAIALVDPGGVLVSASCSSRIDAETFYGVVHDAARRRSARLHELARTGHAVDHPISFPQGAYLKALVARVS